MNSLNN